MKNKEWKPVHEVCIEDLSEPFIQALKLLHWAGVYAKGAIVPPKDIPGLIKAFQDAEIKLNREAEFAEISSAVRLAISNLSQQLKRAKKASAEKTVEVECYSCGATGLFRGFAESKGVAVVCRDCGGSGSKTIKYIPFTGRKTKNKVKTVFRAKGSTVDKEIGPYKEKGGISYEDFLAGKMPPQ